MRRSKLRAVPALLVGWLLTGCTDVIISQPAPCSGQGCNTAEGFTYSLPKGQFLLEAHRHPVSSQDVAAAGAALTAANAVVAKDVAAYQAALKTQADDQTAKAPQSKIDADGAPVTSLKKLIDSDSLVADQAQNALNLLTAGQGKGIETFTLTKQDVAPDPHARFTANLNHSWLRDDTFKISSSAGLLTSASSTSTDQSLTSFVKLAETAISVATFISSGIPLVPTAEDARQDALDKIANLPMSCTYDMSVIFDPLDAGNVKIVNALLRSHNAAITVDIPEGATNLSNDNPKSPVSGLVYRVATSVIVSAHALDTTIWDNGGPPNCPLLMKPGAQSVLAVIPDPRANYVIGANAGAFTTTGLSYTFASGMLSDYSANRPSEVAAPIVAISQLAQDIMAIPGSILKLRLDYSNSSDELVKAQTSLISDHLVQTTTVLKAQKDIADANTSLIKAQIGDIQSWVDAQKSLQAAQQSLQELSVQGGTPIPGATITPLPTH